MKKSVKFSGTKEDNTVYLTAIFIPQKSVNLKECLKLINSSVQLGEDVGDEEVLREQEIQSDVKRFARLEIKKNKLIVRLRYKHDYRELGERSFDHAKRDALHIVEQIETLIDAFEEEGD